MKPDSLTATIYSPAFQTIVGAFVGVLGGRAMVKKDPQ
jgi:hypothetical protein